MVSLFRRHLWMHMMGKYQGVFNTHFFTKKFLVKTFHCDWPVLSGLIQVWLGPRKQQTGSGCLSFQCKCQSFWVRCHSGAWNTVFHTFARISDLNVMASVGRKTLPANINEQKYFSHREPSVNGTARTGKTQ